MTIVSCQSLDYAPLQSEADTYRPVMRDEWKTVLGAQYPGSGSGSSASQGVTRAGRQIESVGGSDRIAGMTMAQKAMKLKRKGSGWDEQSRNLQRKQVGEVADEINSPPSMGDGPGGKKPEQPWWRNVTMEEGI